MTQAEQERERALLRLQAEICQTLADPTRLEIIHLLEHGPRPVKWLVTETGQRQAKISQHLAILRQRGIVQARRVGIESHYALADPQILDACHSTRQLLLRQLARNGALADGQRQQEM